MRRGHGVRFETGSKSRAYEEPRFVYALLTPRKDLIACKFDDGRHYDLPVAALEAAEDYDGTPPVEVRTLHGGIAVIVRLKSGACVDFAADFVLHHCEPDYAHHRGKAKGTNLGTRIQVLRRQRGISQEELAGKTGIAEPNISRLESNRHVPTLKTLQKIARALGVLPRDLLVS